MNKKKLSLFIRLLTCFLMLSSVAILRDAHFMGYEIIPASIEQKAISLQPDGSIIISTKNLTPDIKGYGGAIPLEITITGGRIAEIKALNNAETPSFFEQVESELFPRWKGMTIEEAVSANIDGITGATLSSNAVNSTIHSAIKTYSEKKYIISESHPSKSLKYIISLLVIAVGAIVPFFYKHKLYRIIQLCLNIIVLGLWSGTFISYSLIINYLSNGTNIYKSLIPITLLLIAFIYPFFGKKNHYCMWICPLGSLQELVGKCVKRKWPLSIKTLNYLNKFNEILWALLMLLMWSGICFSWIDYELFSVFLLSHASIYIIIATLLFIGLSFFISRPYCRFVCPTGCLLRISQNVK